MRICVCAFAAVVTHCECLKLCRCKVNSISFG